MPGWQGRVQASILGHESVTVAHLYHPPHRRAKALTMQRTLPIVVAMFVLAMAAHAEDVRRQSLKDLNGYFPSMPRRR